MLRSDGGGFREKIAKKILQKQIQSAERAIEAFDKKKKCQLKFIEKRRKDQAKWYLKNFVNKKQRNRYFE